MFVCGENGKFKRLSLERVNCDSGKTILVTIKCSFFFSSKQSKSSWFKKKGKETKLRHLQQWIEDILAGKVELKEPVNSTETTQDGKTEEAIQKDEL